MAQSVDTNLKISVVDLETTSIGGDPDWTNPHNRMVLGGVLNLDEHEDYNCYATTGVMSHVLAVEEGGRRLIVGHNLMFDVGYLVRDHVIENLGTDYAIWDTQVAEYLLSGQRDRFISLEALCKKYSINFSKDPVVAKHFEDGKGADTLPPMLLTKYLREDVIATGRVFARQWERAEKMGMIPLIQSIMAFRLASIDMRINGINVDSRALDRTRLECEEIMEKQEHITHKVLATLPVYYRDANLNPLVAPQLNTLLFGGECKKKERQQDGHYKNGNPKFKNVETVWNVSGMLKDLGVHSHSWEPNTSEDNLEDIGHFLRNAQNPALRQFGQCIDAVLAWRKAKKIISTYVEPTQNYLRHLGCLRPTIQSTATATGRTSCSGPNLQNVPKNSIGKYRKCIVPHHMVGAKRVLVEFDYSQLEVVALALLSGDVQLIADIVAGVDLHAELYKMVHGRSPSKEERRQFKRAVFALIYGGGPKAIAMQGDTTRAIAKDLLKAWAKRYPDTLKYRNKCVGELNQHAVVSPDRKYGIPHKVSMLQTFTGRRYFFEQRLHKNWTTGQPFTDWSEQEVANYPVQGTATADIVLIMVGELWRYMHDEVVQRLEAEGEWTPTLLLMAVHDSALMEMDERAVEHLVPLFKALLEGVPEMLKRKFGVDCKGIPFKVGVSIGPNWEDMEDKE